MPKCLADKVIMFSIIGLVAWAIIGLPIVKSLERPEAYQHNQTDKAQSKGGNSSAVWNRSIPQKNGASGHQENRWYGVLVDHAPDWFVAIFTGLLAYATYRLVKSTNNLWTATKDASERQELDTRVLQRAYLSVEPGGINQFLDGTPRLSCDILIRNAGNLPAKHVSWFIERIISQHDNLRDFHIGEREGKIVLAPKAVAKKGTKNNLPKLNVLNLRPNPGNPSANWIYVWGRVDYHDGFKGDRFIEFCHRYNIGASGTEGDISAEAGRYHESGNRTDEH